MKKTLLAATSLLAFTAAHADPQATTIILNSASPMTQGIALVLANQMQGQGAAQGDQPVDHHRAAGRAAHSNGLSFGALKRACTSGDIGQFRFRPLGGMGCWNHLA